MKLDKKQSYFLICCFCLVFSVVGATYAYFTASASDENTVVGDAATVSFGLSVDKVTTVDMAYGLIPMRNDRAPEAAVNKCRDIYGNAGCQIYKITVKADSDIVMFLDGYIETFRQEGVDTRISQVFYDVEADTFYTGYSVSDFETTDFVEEEYIKTGVRVSEEPKSFNHTDDYQCLFIKNEKIGGDVGIAREFYMMIWVYDNNEPQNYLQGMQLAYTGKVTFQTAEGNEISATFD